ncbi:mediator of DNA damage checkpoint protein 1 isoform X2 [Xenopus laevis]|nr:mediator of DNA damage checkpoint protein 1 isoform X2 [Xenopus laevis]OCT67923.1 hypothetical protein XELAEV_18039221mg [Xenopus laevis]
MDDTQRLQWDDEEQNVSLDRDQPIGKLHMFNGIHGPAQDFPIYPGTNIIGRHANCDVTLPAQSVSKKHAIIEVQSGCHTLCDQGSLNKTRRGKAALAPNVRYALSDGDLLLFADVACSYSFTECNTKTTEEEAANEESEDDMLVPGTQATLSIEETPGLAIRRMGKVSVLAMDSGDEEEEELKEKDLHYEAKGFKTSREKCKLPASVPFSHNMDTIVPESDEENDTSASEPRFPSLNLRCDGDTDTHETPVKAGTSYIPSKDCVFSPPMRGQNMSDNSVSNKDEITKYTLIGHQESFADEQANTEHKTLVKCDQDTSIENDRETKEEEDASTVNTSNIAGQSGTGVKDSPLISNPKVESQDIDSVKVENQSREFDYNKTLQAGIKQQESTDISSDNDTNMEKNQTSKAKLVNTGSEGIILESDTDGEEEDCTNSKEADDQKREGAAFHLDSDTDIEEGDNVSSGMNVHKVENSGNKTDSDTDVEETKPKSKETAVQKKVEEGFHLDSDTDVEDDDSNFLNIELKNTEKAKMIQDSDTDVEDITTSKVEVDRKTASNADTKGDNRSTSPNAEVKMQEKDLSILDSDTDVEDVGDGCSLSVVKKQNKAETSHTNLTETTAVEESCTSADIEKVVKPADRHESHTDGVIQEQKATPEFQLDSDTDIEDEDNSLDVSSTSAKVKITEVHSDNLEKQRPSPEEIQEKRVVEIDLDISTDMDEADETDVSRKEEVDEADETEVDRKEAFHMDSDTDLEDNDSGPSVVHGAEKQSTATEHSDSTSDTGASVKNVTSTIVEKTEKGETDGIDCEGAEYDMMATQCYLEPEEKESDIQDEDNCAEEATQAFILSSTWAELDPFKRPANPIGVLQISAVTVSSSEEEMDENVIAETQPFCCEIRQPEEHSVQELAKQGSSAEEKNNAACSMPQEEISQDDTQPVSQFLNTTPSSNVGNWVATATTNSHQEKHLDRCNVEQIKQVDEHVPDMEGQADKCASIMEEDATQPYILDLPTVGDTITQPCNLSEAVSEDCVIQPLNTVVPAVVNTDSLPSNPSVQLSDGEAMEPHSLNEAVATQSHVLNMPLTEDNTVSISEGEKASVRQGTCSGEISIICEQLDASNKDISNRPGEVLPRSPAEKATEHVAKEQQQSNGATRITEEGREASKGRRPFRRSRGGEKDKDSAEVIISTTRGKRGTWKKTEAAAPASEDTKSKKIPKLQKMEKELPEAKIEDECKEDHSSELKTSSILVDSKTGRKGKQDTKECLDDTVEDHVKGHQVEEDVKSFTSRRSVRKRKDEKDQEAESSKSLQVSFSKKRSTRQSNLDLGESVGEKAIAVSSDEHGKHQMDDEVFRANKTTRNLKSKGAKRNVKDEEDNMEKGEISEKRPTGKNRENVTEKNNEKADLKRRVTRRNSSQLETVETIPDNIETVDSERQDQSRKSPNIKKELKGDDLKVAEKCGGTTKEDTEKCISRRTKKGCKEEMNEQSKEQTDGKQRVTRRNSRLSETVESKPEDTDIVDSERQAQPRKSRNIKKSLKRDEDETLEDTNQENTEKFTSRRTKRQCKERLNMEGHEKSKGEPSIEHCLPINNSKEAESEQENAKAEEQDQSKKSRKTKKDLKKPVVNEEEHLLETISKDPEVRTSRRTKKGCREEDPIDGSIPVIGKSKQDESTRKNVSRSTRKNSKEEPKEVDTEENVVVSKKENLDAIQTTRRARNSKVDDMHSVDKTLCASEPKSGNPDGKTRKKNQKEASGTQKNTEVEKEMSGGSVAIEKEQLSPHEDISPTGVRKSRRTSTKEELSKSSTLAPVRKRVQEPKTGADEVKRKKVNEELEQEQTVGRRDQARQPNLEDENTESNSIEKDSTIPLPSPLGNSRLRPSTAFESPPEARTPRRAVRNLTTSPYTSQRSITAKVLFTGVVDPAGEETIRNLGGEVAESIFDCTHLVTDRIRRTVKFLCALARGIPIVTLDWLDKCKKSKCFLSPAQFLVKDKEQEKNFNFVLSESLQKAKKKPLFQGYEIHVTPNVKPEPEHMKDIIQCSGATFLAKMPKVYKEKYIIVSCKEDSSRYKSVPSRIPVTSAEFILTGILRQEINPQSYLLSAEEALPTPAKRRR